jgi:hypothetical protein
VVKVIARERKPKLGNGTAWIDAQSFVTLKGEYFPAGMPKQVDWLKVHTQHALHASGFALPTALRVDGAGHFLFIKRGFRLRMKWLECK